MSSDKSITVSDPWFDQIQSGKKTIEGRVKFGFFGKLNKGDKIKLSNSDKSKFITCTVENLEDFKNFHDLLDGEKLNKVFPDAKTVNDGLEIYKKFYKDEDIEKNGVVAITLKVHEKSGGRVRSKSKSKKKSRSRSRSRSKSRRR